MKYDLSDIEVRERELVDLISAFFASSFLANLILQEEKIDTLMNNRYQFFSEKRYPSINKLKLLQLVLHKTSSRILRKVGEKVPEYAVFPSEIDNIYKAILIN